DPFTLVEENGFFYGRGTEDIKQGVTQLAATFIRLKQQGFVPTRDLIIYFSGDEETDGNTAQDTVKNHRDLVDAEFALNADGGGGNLSEEDASAISYSLQTSEKTYASFELTTHNPGGHSSAPGAENALPQSATATVNCRIFPGHSVDDVKATLEKVAGPKVTVTTIGKPFPAPASPLRQDVLDAVTYAVHTLHPGIPIVPSQSSGA